MLMQEMQKYTDSKRLPNLKYQSTEASQSLAKELNYDIFRERISMFRVETRNARRLLVFLVWQITVSIHDFSDALINI